MCVTAAALNTPVAALVQRCGIPDRVASRDDGHHFIFTDDGAHVDVVVDPDVEAVRALDIRATPPVIANVTVDDTPRAFAFGRYDIARADAELAGAADYSFAAGRAYRLDATHELVLSFDPETKKLARISVGERPTLERMNLLAQPIDRRPFTYTAPVPKRTSVTNGSGTHVTIARLDIDEYGIVRHVTIVVSSDDGTFDDALAARFGDELYVPARLANRSVAGSVFREVRH